MIRNKLKLDIDIIKNTSDRLRDSFDIASSVNIDNYKS